MATRILRLGTLAALLAGCPAIDGDPGDPWVEIGTGVEEFEALEDGDVLAVERGSQAGQHVWGSLRANAIDPGSTSDYDALLNADRPVIGFELECPDGILSYANAWQYPIVDAEDGTQVLVGRLVEFRHWVEFPENPQEIDWEQFEFDLEDTDMIFRLRVEEADGAVYVDERTVRIDFPPRNQDDDE